MKIFITGLPNSCRTSVSCALSKQDGNKYISTLDWFKETFRPKHKTETDEDYYTSFMEYMIQRLKIDPLLFSNQIKDVIKSFPHQKKIYYRRVT
jgi:cytidylate kinase